MATLKYKIIKSKTQYNTYCKALESLLGGKIKDKAKREEIDLLTLLIEKWDEEHTTFEDADPIELLQSLMEGHNLKSKDLVAILNLTKGGISDILNYKRGLSKETIRILSNYFKMNQEAFNRPYKLVTTLNSHLRNASVMNSPKELGTAKKSANTVQRPYKMVASAKKPAVAKRRLKKIKAS
jgi:HTH-type transcriptional regulator/antitoxin HigA